ncbi:MAG: Rne/Rng family ribonuclease [Pseudomonadaceae bacterium]|nr:Rne/Rng family ribonuclease [Pseudomonadaceae bacterium]
MKRMLINATQPEEVRVALVDGQKLYDLDIENRSREQKKGSIYKARITRVEPSLEAAFVDFGSERHGFLPLKEISREYFTKKPDDIGGKLNIAELVKEGTEILVQVDKEERGTKGAALTTFISLAGRYMVLMPNNPRAGGISRRIEGDDRTELREALATLEIPKGMGVIVRTAGVGRSEEELQWDLNYLLQLWDAISRATSEERAPKLIYQENNVILRALRDNLRRDIGELLIDGKEAYEEAKSFIDDVMPNYQQRVKYYDDPIPLFSRYQIESQIETAFQRDVRLPSGGSIVIDPTEALVSIDINSARATKGADIEETALNTNLEAADEICRQLRLRDMGGLIVIDYIDMSSKKNQKAVEERMRKALDADRARVQISHISRFGLMEMSRQRLRPSLGELTMITCPRCEGEGRIRDTKSLALAILRLLEEEALKEGSTQVRALVPLEISAYLLNEKRTDVASIESRTGTHIVIVPDVNMETPQYDVQRIRDENATSELAVPSYELAPANTAEIAAIEGDDAATPIETASVSAIPHTSPAPKAAPAAANTEPDGAAKTAAAPAPAKSTPQPVASRTSESSSLLKRIAASLFGTAAVADAPQAAPAKAPKDNRPARGDSKARSERSKDDSRRDNRSNQDGDSARSGGGRNRNRNRDDDSQRRGKRSEGQARGGEQKTDRGEGASRKRSDQRSDEKSRGGESRGPNRSERDASRSRSEGSSRGRASTSDEGSNKSQSEGKAAQNAAEEARQRKRADIARAETDARKDDIAASKRRPPRNREAEIAEAKPEPRSTSVTRVEPAPKAAAAEANAPEAKTPEASKPAETTTASPAPDAKPSKPESTASRSKSTSETSEQQTESVAEKAPATEPAKPKTPLRAANDPREVRRRQRQEELKQQGVISGNTD